MSDSNKDDDATLKISAAKYSTVVDFEENMEREDSELDEKEKEEVHCGKANEKSGSR